MTLKNQINLKIPSKLKKDYFQKLRSSILLLMLKQETLEPQQFAVDGVTEELARINRISEYLRDIERIKKEMFLAKSLISAIPDNNFIEKHGSTPEEYILYHYSSFLDLIHQLKDKICHLCDGVTTAGKYKEKKSIKVSSLIKKAEIKNIKGLGDELIKWQQDSKNPIGWALKKRTRHHHFRSRLTLDRSYLDTQLYRSFQKNPPEKALPKKYQKKLEIVKLRGIIGIQDWHTKVNEDFSNIITFVEKSLEKLSKKLYENCNLPDIDKEAAEIVSENEKMRASLKVKSISSRNKVPLIYEPLVKMFEEKIPEILKEELTCLYLVGSIPREEAVIGYSDINFVFVVDNDLLKQVLKEVLVRFIVNFGSLAINLLHLLDIKVLSKEEFLADNNKKLRFICKTDGIVLAGKDIILDEKFPNVGLRLALLLNSDVREITKEYSDFLNKNKNVSQEIVDKIAIDVSKIALRLLFSGVMSERAIYERNLKIMRNILNGRYPQNAELTETLFRVSRKKAKLNVGNLKALLSRFSGENKPFGSVLKQIEVKNAELGNRKIYR